MVVSTSSTPARPGPVRTCVGCRQRATKFELIRVVVDSDSHGAAVVPDPDGTAHGRGAHLHPTTACLDLAEHRRAFPRALRLTGGLDVSPVRTWINKMDNNRERPNRNWSSSS